MIFAYWLLTALFFSSGFSASSASSKVNVPANTKNSNITDVEMAYSIIAADFRMSALMTNINGPLSVIVINDGFSLVSLTTNIDVETVRVPVMQLLIRNFVLEVIQKLIKDVESDEQEKKERLRLVHIITILIYEAKHFNVDIPVNQAKVLFEYIFRYGAQKAPRYQKALEKLTKHIITDPGAFTKLYEALLKSFDPYRSSIPFIFADLSDDAPVRIAQRSMLRKHYEKIIETVDPMEDKVLFNYHMNPLIVNIISFNDISEFFDIILDVLPHINAYSLFKTYFFYQRAVDAIIRGFNSNSFLLDLLICSLVTEELIDKLDDDLLMIQFGDIMNIILRRNNELSKKLKALLGRLPENLKLKINRINELFNKFEMMRFRLESCEFLGIRFRNMNENDLKTLIKEMEELIEYFPFLKELSTPLKLNNLMKNVAKTFDSLISSVESYAKTPQLQIYRFKVFFDLFKLLTFNPAPSINLTVCLSKCLKFFALLIKVTPEGADDLVLALKIKFNSLVLAKKHFIEAVKYQDLLTFLTVCVGLEQAVLEMSCLLLGILRASDYNFATFKFVESICLALEIPFIPIASLFVSHELVTYLETPKDRRDSLRAYKDGKFSKMMFEIYKENYLSRTESDLVELMFAINKLTMK